MKSSLKLIAIMVISTIVGNQVELIGQQTHEKGLIQNRNNSFRRYIMNKSQYPVLPDKFSSRTFNNFSDTDRQKLDSVLYEYMDENTGQLGNDYKDELFYNESAKTILIKGYLWDEGQNSWINYDSIVYEYDINGNRTIYIYYDRDFDINQWIAYEKEEEIFDGNGNLIQHLEYEYDNITGQLVKKYKQAFVLNDDGVIIQELYYSWDDNLSDWVPTGKWENVLSDFGKVEQSLSYYWDNLNDVWFFIEKVEFTYDQFGNRTQSISYWGDPLEQTGKYEFSYDDDGNLIQFINYQWNADENNWTVFDNQEFFYDSNGNITYDNDYEWFDSTNSWVLSWQEEFDFNYSFSIDDLLVPDDYHELNYLGVPMKNMVIEYRFYSWNDSVKQMVVEEKMDFYYSNEIPTGINIAKESCLIVYPNPTKERVIFKLNNELETANVEIFSLEGVKVVSKEFHGNISIYVGNLKSGIYFFKLKAGENIKVQTGKILID